MTSAAVGAATRHCVMLSQAHRLAAWVGDGKPVTPKQVLRPRDVPAAAHILNIPVPARINTAAKVPALNRLWEIALAIGFLRIVEGQAVTGPVFGQWPDIEDGAAGELWLNGLITAFAADAGNHNEAGAAAFAHIVLGALTSDPAPSVVELWERVLAAPTFEDSYVFDPFFTAYRDRFRDPVTGIPGGIPDVLTDFGAAILDGAQLEATPLGHWAMQEITARMPQSISVDLSADELIARVIENDENDPGYAAQPWLLSRAPLQAARELLAAAATATPAQRIIAVEIVDALGEPAHDAWREAVTVPTLAAHARMALTEWTDWRRPPDPTPEDAAWLAVEYAVGALTTSGPDEALACIDERISGADLDSRLHSIQSGDHPDIAVLTEALTAFVASAAKPTSSQVYQLKISLQRMRNPVWRRVLVPATARLGLLHEVIQIVMNWEGDHLHAFFVGKEHYGDPCFSPDMHDEERLRLSHAFTSTTKTITYLYDFGASWYHDVTFEKVLDLDPGRIYPVCLAGKGDFPTEYWTDEGDDQQSILFDKDKVNSRLARLASSAPAGNPGTDER